MSDHYPLSEYAPGEKFSSILVCVRSARASIGKNGKSFVDMKIGDWSGSRSAKYWNASEHDVEKLCAAEFLLISGDVDSSQTYSGDFTVRDYRPAEMPDDVTPFLERPHPKNNLQRKQFNEIIKSIKDVELYAILKQIFGVDPEFLKRFCRAYAASSVHHAFPGGLLEHTLEVATLCSKVCDVLPDLDRDLLVTAAILHDVGKMDEMNQELRAGEYTDEGVMLGHLVIGSVWIAQAVDRHNSQAPEGEKISPKTKRALMHLILSHHGLPEHGAAVKPSFAEATVLYLCDNISAKTRMHLDAMLENKSGAISSHHRFLDGRIYLKKSRDQGAQRAQSADDFLSDGTPEPLPLPIMELASGELRTVAIESENCRLTVPPREGADYLLRITDENLSDMKIHAGDLLFVKKQDHAEDGSTILAQKSENSPTIIVIKPSELPETLEFKAKLQDLSVIFSVIMHTLPFSNLVAARVILILAAFAALSYAAKRTWLRRTETIIVGGAIIFCAIGWLLPQIVFALRPRYPDPTHALLLSIAIVLPLAAAMAVGIYFLIRKMPK